jgi:hypothetical protein
MISGLFRVLSWLILAGGVVLAVVDATRSVAANSLQLTGLGKVFETYWPALTGRLLTVKDHLAGKSLGGWPLANVIDFINSVPVSLLAAGLFLLIYGLASRNRETRHF